MSMKNNIIPTTQTVNGFTVVRVKSESGERGFRVFGGRFKGEVVPLGLVPMLASPADQFMKSVVVPCGDCSRPVPAGELECDMCQSCYDLAGEENAEQDGN